MLKAYERRKENQGHLTPSWINHFNLGVQSIEKKLARMYAGDTTILDINGSNKMLYGHPDNKTPFTYDEGRKEYEKYLKIN